MPYKHTRQLGRLELESTAKLLREDASHRRCCGRGGKLCPSVKLCYHKRGDSSRNSQGRAAGEKGNHSKVLHINSEGGRQTPFSVRMLAENIANFDVLSGA